MTDKQMDDLAIRVATKVVKAIFNVSSEVHLVFENQNDQSDFIIESKDDLDKQTIELELIRLQSLLERYEQEEAYEKANIIKRKIQIIKNKYDKLD
jgi:protein-arginine kinase activator protein McsA